MASNIVYSPHDFGTKEVNLIKKFNIQLEDARFYFTSIIRPRLDRSYKLYISYTGDRAAQIKKWQANVFVPYTHAAVETLIPRIIDARPDFNVQGRNEDDQLKAVKQKQLHDYTWEIAGMDAKVEDLCRASLVYGQGYLQSYWKRDIREYEFFSGQNINKNKDNWVKKKKTFYDAPYAEWVDNYDLWYDWRNVNGRDKQFWFKRKILSGEAIKLKYPMYDKKRLNLAFKMGAQDLTNYASIRNEVKFSHEKISKGGLAHNSFSGISDNIYQDQSDNDLKMHEVFEWWRPFDDRYSVMVNGVPIFKNAEMPNPYNHKEAPFIEFPYLKLPNEYEGIGLPIILENPQIMLNMIKNQRLDSATLSIHKMWIVNPMANINKDELVTRPFGIIYSPDPNGVREVQFGDIKQSAYKEEDLLKSDMRYASGVDDASMGSGSGGAGSATEVRHLRESTLERVRLFVNHLGSGFARLMRMWMSMQEQFYTRSMVMRITGDDGEIMFPIIEKDDLRGEFDYKATVLPSIAGQNDVDKKQDMDLFQLLIGLPFTDPRKLTSKILHHWNWTIDSIAKASEGNEVTPEMQQLIDSGQIPPDQSPDPMNQLQRGDNNENQLVSPSSRLRQISPDKLQQALALMGGGQQSQFSEASLPINLLQGQAQPPTVKGLKGMVPNIGGLNRGGKVNTNIPSKGNSSIESNLINRALNIQR